jgi:hypothetical protein
MLTSRLKEYVKKDLDEQRVKLMFDLTDLLMNTDYISEESKLYLSVRYINYAGMVDELYKATGKLSNESAIQSRVWYDKKKLVNDLGENIVLDTIEYTKQDITKYMDRISVIRLKVNKVDLLKEVSLEFPREVVYCDDITDEQFEEFLDVIAPYTKNCMKQVVSNIDENVLGYIRYITTHSIISETDKDRYNQLKELAR